MAKLITKFKYLKPNARTSVGGYAKYIATREGVDRVALSTSLFYEKSQEQKKPEFLEKYKKRSAQEWKNGEMKRFHGLSRARGWGLRSILFQAKLTAIAVNLKRIATITGKKTRPVIAFFKKIEDYFQKLILKTDFATIFLLADC